MSRGSVWALSFTGAIHGSHETMSKGKNRSKRDVFSDLGFGPNAAAHLRIRADLLLRLQQALEALDLKQTEVAKLLGITQPRVSDLVRGRLDLFSIDTLVDLLARLGVGVQIGFTATKRQARVA